MRLGYVIPQRRWEALFGVTRRREEGSVEGGDALDVKEDG